VPLWKLIKQFPGILNQKQMADQVWRIWLSDSCVKEMYSGSFAKEFQRMDTLFNTIVQEKQ